MKVARLILSLLMVSSALLLAVTASAQLPVPPRPNNRTPRNPAWREMGGRPSSPIEWRATIPGSPAVILGQPGTSYRYVKTFGETEVAYPSDTAHINYPWGLGTDGNNIWIGELWGNRALKYTNTGSFQMQIGLAGYADIYDTVLWEITDVAVDGSGNVWLVDGSISHLVKFNASGDKLGELGVAWEPGSGNDRFDQPQSIAIDTGGNMYVSDGSPWWNSFNGNHRIQIFNSAGNYLATIGQTGTCGTGNNQLCGPRHITIYGTQLFIADAGNHRVQIFNITTPASPVYVATIGVPGASGSDNAHLDNPSGVAVDADYIYIADAWNNRVQVFNRVSRAYVTTIGGVWGSNNDQFKNPSDVAIDASGYLYVADFVNTRVQQFSRSASVFTYQRTYGDSGMPYVTDDAHFNRPSGVVVDNDGNIYLTEEYGHRLVKLDANGALQWAVGAAGVKGDWDDSDYRLNNPADVALGADGRIYIADRWHGRVQIYNPDSSYYATVGDLWCPGGVGVAPNNFLYVADSCQNTVQIYDTNLNLVTTLGESGVWGSDEYHFNWPMDVAIDSTGMIYVADNGNLRLQVYDDSLAYVRTMGETGVWGSDFDHFGWPNGLFVDGSNNLFVADSGNDRIQVFDATGAYLTTIGGSWGNNTDQVQAPGGVAVDLNGNVFIADGGNHRIQKYAPGVPGWRQVNINGFGERENYWIGGLTSFGDHLYAGTYHPGTSGQLWRMSSNGYWENINNDGFGDGSNLAVDSLIEFNGKLYAGTWNDTGGGGSNGGQLWRSSTGNSGGWEKVVDAGFGSANNVEVFRLSVFEGLLYASTWNETSGSEIWRSGSGNLGSWSSVITGGSGDTGNIVFVSITEFNGYMYLGSYNDGTGAEVWRSNTGNGGTWSQVNIDGFGDPYNWSVILEPFKGYLYAATYNYASSDNPGFELWRCQTCDGSDWTQVPIDKGLGDTENRAMRSLVVHEDALYGITFNNFTGLEVWRSFDGVSWSQVGIDGLGDSNNTRPYWDNSVVVYNNNLFIGTSNFGNGGEVWQLMPAVYLPIVLKQSAISSPSWSPVTSGVTTDLNSVSMLSSSMGFTVGNAGTILKWGGSNWAPPGSPIATDLTSVSISSANNAWAVSDTTVLKWNGTNWSQVVGSPNLPFQVVDADADNAWMVGGYMLCSPDCNDLMGFVSRWNGSAWSTSYSQHKYLYAIDMLSATDGWAVGDIYDPENPLPAIIRWNGSNWNNQTHPDVRGLYDISALDSNNAWAVGVDTNMECTLQRWNGSSWTSYTCPVGVDYLSAVSMVSANDVWAVGGDDLIHWNGTNWTRSSYTPPYQLNDIDMISSNEGWAVGNHGVIVHYSP